jgi:hypothetical protein
MYFDLLRTKDFSNIKIILFKSSILTEWHFKIKIKVRDDFGFQINTKSKNSLATSQTDFSFNSTFNQTFHSSKFLFLGVIISNDLEFI